MTTKFRAILGVALLVLAWVAVPTVAHNTGYKIFASAGCVGHAENRATYGEVLAASSAFRSFMILHEGTTCYAIP